MPDPSPKTRKPRKPSLSSIGVEMTTVKFEIPKTLYAQFVDKAIKARIPLEYYLGRELEGLNTDPNRTIE